MIHLIGNLYIKVESTQYILLADDGKRGKSGKSLRDIYGYYGTLAHALEAAREHIIREGLASTTCELDEAIEFIKSETEMFRKLIKERGIDI